MNSLTKRVDSAKCNAGSRGSKQTTMLVPKTSTSPTDRSISPKVPPPNKTRRRRSQRKKRKVVTPGEGNPAEPIESVPCQKTKPGPQESEWKSRELEARMDAEANDNGDFGYRPDPSVRLGTKPVILRHGYKVDDSELWLDIRMGSITHRVSFEDANSDMPRKLAFYIQDKRIGTRGQASKGPYHRWAEEFLRASERVI